MLARVQLDKGAAELTMHRLLGSFLPTAFYAFSSYQSDLEFGVLPERSAPEPPEKRNMALGNHSRAATSFFIDFDWRLSSKRR